MASESDSTSWRRSNSRGGVSATRKIPAPRERISFRDLAKFAQRRKTVAWLVDATGKDESTIKRYFSRKHEPPGSVVNVVVTDILQRLEFCRVEQPGSSSGS